MSRRFQFSLKALLLAVFGVACFCGGVSWQRHLDKPVWWGNRIFGSMSGEYGTQEMLMPDGEVLTRKVQLSAWERTGKLSAEETQLLANETQDE